MGQNAVSGHLLFFVSLNVSLFVSKKNGYYVFIFEKEEYIYIWSYWTEKKVYTYSVKRHIFKSC